MRSLTIITTCLIAAGLAAVAVRTCPDGRTSRNAEMVLPGTDDLSVVTEGAEIDAAQQQLARQVERSNTMADELIAGRTTLAEVVDQLVVLNQNRATMMLNALRRYHQRFAAGERELYARYILTKIQIRLADDPARLAAVTLRLNAEFHALVPTDEQVFETGVPDPTPAPARALPGYGLKQVTCE